MAAYYVGMRPVKGEGPGSAGSGHNPGRDLRHHPSASGSSTVGATDAEAAGRLARETFVRDGNPYGRAETTYVVLKRAYGHPARTTRVRPWR